MLTRMASIKTATLRIKARTESQKAAGNDLRRVSSFCQQFHFFHSLPSKAHTTCVTQDPISPVRSPIQMSSGAEGLHKGGKQSGTGNEKRVGTVAKIVPLWFKMAVRVIKYAVGKQKTPTSKLYDIGQHGHKSAGTEHDGDHIASALTEKKSVFKGHDWLIG